MSTFSVRGLSDHQLASLKEQARRQGISMNRLALHRLTHPEGGKLEQVDPELWA